MAVMVADVDLGTRPEPDGRCSPSSGHRRVMVVAGLRKGGPLLRFVPTAVMMGFVTAVGVNIVLGQLTNLTGCAGRGANRLFRAIGVAHVRRFDLPTLIVGS